MARSGFGNVAVNGVHQLEDRLLTQLARITFKSLEGGTFDDGNVVAGEVVGGKQFANFKLYQFDQFFVIDHVGLVQEHDDIGYADLTGKQDVLAGLGHRAVGCGDNQDRAVHLGSTGDHVLDVVGMAGAVNVGIMTVVGLVFDVGGRDGDAALTLFRSVVDLVERLELGLTLAGQ